MYKKLYVNNFIRGSVVCFTRGVPFDSTRFNFVLVRRYRPTPSLVHETQDSFCNIFVVSWKEVWSRATLTVLYGREVGGKPSLSTVSEDQNSNLSLISLVWIRFVSLSGRYRLVPSRRDWLALTLS